MTVQLLITSGKGPVECRAAVGQVLCRMQAEAEALGIGFDQVSRPSDGGPISAIVALHGTDAAAFAAQWCGTVQWIAESRFRQGHRRKNWFVGVFAMIPEPSATVLDLADVRVETCRAGGSGGQHVNTTDSAVRMVHLPTGLSVIARDGRSQIQNRKVAQERLGRLFDLQRRLVQAENQRLEHELHQGLVRGNPRRRFHGPQFIEMA